MTRLAREAYVLICGKYPHPQTIVPGGMSSTITLTQASIPIANQPVMSAPTIVQNHYWQAIDGPSVQKFVNSDAFTYHMGRAMEFNKGFMTTRLTNGQKGMR